MDQCKPTIDPEFKSLIPPLTAEEHRLLKASLIEAKVCRDPLVTWRGLLLDGHNRLTICDRYDIPYQVTEIDLPDRQAAFEWIVNNQLARRNLTSFTRAEMVARCKALLAQQAKERQKGGQGGKLLGPELAQAKGRTSDKLADLAGIGRGTLLKAEKLIAEASPEVLAQLRSGKVSTHSAYQKLLSHKETDRRKSVVKQAKHIQDILCADARKVEYPDGIRLLLTDPPYGVGYQSNRRTASAKDPGLANDDQHAVKLFGEVLSRVQPHLADDAHLLVFASWHTEHEFRQALEAAGFTVKGSLIWIKSNHGTGDLRGSFAPQHERIIHAVQGNPEVKPRISDVLTGTDVRGDHPTAKPVDLLRKLIEVCTVPGELVADPFAGGGSTGLAARELGRRYYLVELDPYFHSQAAGVLCPKVSGRKGK